MTPDDARPCPPEFPHEPWRAVQARLDGVARDHKVKLLWAIESGSRAWGFPSPDSDFDARFIYARSVEDHLRVDPIRDVIETPLDGELDVNGWDLAKALRLLLKGNAVVIEWLHSPILYRGDTTFAAEMLALGRELADRNRIVHHYRHLGQGQLAREISGRETIKLKQAFYALRPALALRYLRLNRNESLPPMSLSVLMAGSDLPATLTSEIEALVALKRETREMGSGPIPGAIRDLIESELGCEPPEAHETVERGARIAAANAFYRRWVPREP
jgi:predicted nucleotidyltransferase